MKHDESHRLPPPPLFTIRPPPKPPGLLFENFQTIEILNGQCVRPSLNFLNTSSSSPVNSTQHDEKINWLNLFLLVLAAISVVFCIIIAIFIFICLRKLRKEEKQYKDCIMSASLTLRSHHQQRNHIDECARTNEHYKCTTNAFSCCDDYYSHQLIPMKGTSSPSTLRTHEMLQRSTVGNIGDGHDTPQNHQYECIPEYILTMARHHRPPMACHHAHPFHHQSNSTCGMSYTSFSRSYLLPQVVTTASTSDSSQCTCSPPASTTMAQEESSAPLLASAASKESHRREETSSSKSMMIGWTRRNSSSSIKQKSTDQKYSFLSQLRKSTVR